MNLSRLQQSMRDWLETGDPDCVGHFGESARPGLDVYLNNYRTQLLRCLEKVFPHTRTWIGEEPFFAAARQHIMATPPNAWSLDDYSQTFAAKADTLFPDDPVAAELAQLEQAISDAQTAEDRTPLTREMIAHVDWEHASLVHASGGQVLCHKSNAAAIWSSLARAESPPAAERLSGPAKILVWRCEWVPCFRVLDQDEAEIFAAMAAPLAFADVCNLLERRSGAQAAIKRAGMLLARWADDEAIGLN